MDLASVIDEVGSWPVEDRLRLIEEVWESLSSTTKAVTLTEAQKQDLQSRLDAHRHDPNAGIPWEEVEASLRDDAS